MRVPNDCWKNSVWTLYELCSDSCPDSFWYPIWKKWLPTNCDVTPLKFCMRTSCSWTILSCTLWSCIKNPVVLFLWLLLPCYWEEDNFCIIFWVWVRFEKFSFKMTISYQRDVASSTAGGFTRLLFKWKGSLYKLIYRELLLFLSAFIFLSLVYRQLLTQHQRR